MRESGGKEARVGREKGPEGEEGGGVEAGGGTWSLTGGWEKIAGCSNLCQPEESFQTLPINPSRFLLSSDLYHVSLLN